MALCALGLRIPYDSISTRSQSLSRTKLATSALSCHTPSMPMKLRYTERVPLRLEKNTASHMDGALRDGETRADFIRAAIGHEIGWRQFFDVDLMTYVASIAIRYGPYVNAPAGLLSLLYDEAVTPLQPMSIQMHDAMTRITDFIAAEREAGRDVPLTDDGIRRLLAVAYPGIDIHTNEERPCRNSARNQS